MVFTRVNGLDIKRLDISSFPEIRALENDFLSKNPQNHYTVDDDDFYKNSLFDNDGLVLGVFDKDKLVGVSASFKLSSYQYSDVFVDLYRNSGVSLKPNETVFFNNTLIHENYRGKGLQKHLREITVKFYNKKGFFAFISTTSGGNIGSIKSLKKVGMKLIGKEETPYSEKPKNLFYMWKY